MSEGRIVEEVNINIKKYFLAPGFATSADIEVEYVKVGHQGNKNGEQVALTVEKALTVELGLDNLTNDKLGGGGSQSTHADHKMGVVGIIVATPNPCTPTNSFSYVNITRSELLV